MGLRNMLVRGKDSDIGHILENVVYLELIRRGYEVFVGAIDDGEVDFVAKQMTGSIFTTKLQRLRSTQTR